jgi:negative regulator of replication initiation
MKKETNKPAISFFSPDPKPRTVVTKLWGSKWRGCVYFSAYERTGQVLQYLSAKTPEKPKELLGIPLWVFTSKDKSEIETRVSEMLQLIRRKERLLTINLN